MLAVALSLVVAAPAPATAATLVVNLPWARPLAGATAVELFMNVTSSDGATLVALRGPGGTRAVMRDAHGRTMATLALPPGVAIALAPRGPHVVLRGLSRRAAVGDYLPLVLTVADREGGLRDIPLRAEVRRRSALEDEGRAHAHRSPPSGTDKSRAEDEGRAHAHRSPPSGTDK